MAIRGTIKKKYKVAGTGVAARSRLQWSFDALHIKKKCAKQPLQFTAGCHAQPDQPSRIACRGQEGPKGSKSTLWLDF
jgi:hypothetical protein